MTYRELYLYSRRVLTEAGIDDPGQEAVLLFGRFFGLDRRGLALRGEECPEKGQEKLYVQALGERAEHRPLQYILGSWEFMGLSLRVGEGVLCPREDTAVLVESLARKLEGVSAPTGLDLCAGTGAVALGLCTLVPGARVTCVERYPRAFAYLEENIRAYPAFHVQGEMGDVLSEKGPESFAPESQDFIASNPPYIPTGELSELQEEVKREPVPALDGGGDGLRFYRAIAENWAPLLKPGGILAVEIGEDQDKEVAELFRQGGFCEIQVEKDWAGLPRTVTARKPFRGKGSPRETKGEKRGNKGGANGEEKPCAGRI